VCTFIDCLSLHVLIIWSSLIIYKFLGHVNFSDEVSAALRIADGALLVVDVIEGVMVNTEQIIKHCITENVPMTLCINKIDRLILELKLPPADAYFKIKFAIEEVNSIIRYEMNFKNKCYKSLYTHAFYRKYSQDIRLSPELGNVCFADCHTGWIFTLKSFAQMYSESFGKSIMILLVSYKIQVCP
jgi:116 kDa U5 small nuclear ribonucleoprotein component